MGLLISQEQKEKQLNRQKEIRAETKIKNKEEHEQFLLWYRGLTPGQRMTHRVRSLTLLAVRVVIILAALSIVAYIFR